MLAEGEYDLSELGVANNDISSLQINEGYQITLYQSANYSGESIIKNTDDSCLIDDSFNDSLSSIRIERVSSPEVLQTLVVLIDFPDAPATNSVAWMDNFFNTPGWNDGENLLNIKDYWTEVSRGNIDIENHVFGYYRAPNTREYYLNQTWITNLELFADAFEWVAQNNPEFSWDQLSLDEDGRIEGLSVITTASIPGTGGTHRIGDRFIAPNGLRGGQMIASTQSLFTILHEYGHMLFSWPDTYNIKGGSGTGRYDLMSSNRYWIGVPNASLLIDVGWIDVENITQSEVITLEENGNLAYRFVNPNDPLEYFVIEARNNKHITTQRIEPSAERGLYIWHLDKNVASNFSIDISEGQHYRSSLEQADGNFDLENGVNAADETDAYGPGAEFSNNTQPNSRWWDGTISGLSITDIRLLENNRISFRVTLD